MRAWRVSDAGGLQVGLAVPTTSSPSWTDAPPTPPPSTVAYRSLLEPLNKESHGEASYGPNRSAPSPGTTTTDQADVRRLIDRYVDQLKAEGAIRSPAVERRFARCRATGYFFPPDHWAHRLED
jgi:hypothetical protein